MQPGEKKVVKSYNCRQEIVAMMLMPINDDVKVTHPCNLGKKKKINAHIEPLKVLKECTACQVPSQSKLIAKYFPYKEGKILLFKAVYIYG